MCAPYGSGTAELASAASLTVRPDPLNMAKAELHGCERRLGRAKAEAHWILRAVWKREGQIFHQVNVGAWS